MRVLLLLFIVVMPYLHLLVFYPLYLGDKIVKMLFALCLPMFVSYLSLLVFSCCNVFACLFSFELFSSAFWFTSWSNPDRNLEETRLVVQRSYWEFLRVDPNRSQKGQG